MRGGLALDLLLVGALCLSCAEPAVPSADELAELQAAVSRARTLEPAARLGCDLLADPDEGATCHGALDALSEAAQSGAAVLVSARACRETQGAECLASARQTARGLLRTLRGTR